MKTAFLIGRAMLGGFFLYNAVHHFRDTDMMADYAKSKGLPMPKEAILASGGLLAIGGASLLTGIKPKYGIAAAVGFLGAVTPTMHDFWNAQDPQQKMNDQINFAKNLALAGAALALSGVREPWPVSVPIGQPSQLDRAKDIGRDAHKFGRDSYKDARKFGREKYADAEKFGRAKYADAEKFSREKYGDAEKLTRKARKSFWKWLAA